ncbi:MAG: hypothetical protein PHC66_04170 [Candidatus Nanoarchaeia archaeon]|nr:hypothetical protein [Candidatus Nanoarchaeia archaeon]MDD5238880.1 hypothetical protein [Candidatus Nanoarchaeia archaeon]
MVYSSEDPYFETINAAIIIVPDSTNHKVDYFKGAGDGKIEVYQPELNMCGHDFRIESNKINCLLYKKVVFVPLKTSLEITTYTSLRNETQRIPLEFAVSRVDSATGIEKVVSNIKAEIYNQFTEDNAKRVTRFVRRYIYPNSLRKPNRPASRASMRSSGSG